MTSPAALVSELDALIVVRPDDRSVTRFEPYVMVPEKMLPQLREMALSSSRAGAMEEALKDIVKVGCMNRPGDDGWCKGDSHSVYCPAGMAIRALAGGERNAVPHPDDPNTIACKWTPETPDVCPYCSGEACAQCLDRVTCEHDSFERHLIKPAGTAPLAGQMVSDAPNGEIVGKNPMESRAHWTGSVWLEPGDILIRVNRPEAAKLQASQKGE